MKEKVAEQQQTRLASFKQNTMTNSTSRRKRQLQVEQFRQKKRTEEIQKKRNMRLLERDYSEDEYDYHSDSDGSRIDEEEFDYFLMLIGSKDVEKVIEGTAAVRNALASSNDPPIQQVIEAGLVGTFHGFLRSEVSELVFEAAWALTNVASGTTEQTEVLLNYNIPLAFKSLMYHEEEKIREQVIWGLGNIAGESISFRDYVLAIDIIVPLVENLHHTKNTSMIHTGVWALSNLTRGSPRPAWDDIKPALSFLSEIIKTDDYKVLADACWILSYMSDCAETEHYKLEEMMNYNIIDRLIELLNAPAPAVQTPALRTIGNFLTSSDECTDLLIRKGVLPKLKKLIESDKKGICKEAMWTISNIAAGTENHIGAILATDLMMTILKIIHTYDFDIKREALWALSNATSGNLNQVDHIVRLGGLNALCEMLRYNDYTVILVSLDGIIRLLERGEAKREEFGENPYSRLLALIDISTRLEELQQHSDETIYKKCVTIIEKYLNEEEDIEEPTPLTHPSTYKF